MAGNSSSEVRREGPERQSYWHGRCLDRAMRIRTVLTIFCLMGPSLNASASQPLLEWEYEVNAGAMLFGSTLAGGFEGDTPVLSQDGMCAMIFSIRNQLLNAPSNLYVLAVLGKNGQLVWRGLMGAIVPRVVFLSEDCLVFQISTQEGTAFSSVPLKTVRITGRGSGFVDIGTMTAGEWQATTSSRSFLTYTRSPIPDGAQLMVKKWRIPRNEVELAPSTFGLEDNNLVISWPTTVGHTYQVQRSSDLQAWEDVGLALTGNDTIMSYSQPSTAERIFLRVVVP